MINFVSSLAKRNTCQAHNEKCLQNKETEENATPVPSVTRTLKGTGQRHGSISCSTIRVYLTWLLKLCFCLFVVTNSSVLVKDVSTLAN